MIATTYLVLFALIVLAITYPDEFPTMIRNPRLLVDSLALELKRRWLILSLGSRLYFEKQMLRYSLWKNRNIIAMNRKQHQENTDD